jgi:hypothetical protein
LSSSILKHAASYKDNDGFVFKHHQKYYRCVKESYFAHYRQLMESGLYNSLTKKKWLISHEEITNDAELNAEAAKVLLPQQIAVISYPYEWSFSMWQDAALLTLNIAKEAIDCNMLLKDATPFNIQFFNGRPVFIDTLSFEQYDASKPWVAYRQFCESFLAPLLLQKYCHIELGKIFAVYPDGIPLQVLTALLPGKAKWNLNNYLHVYLQASVKPGKNKNDVTAAKKFTQQKMLLLLNNLADYIKGLKVKKAASTWDNYYAETILGDNYLQAKTTLVQNFMNDIAFSNVVDLGANDGHFSLLLKNTDKQIISVDGDINCINELYNKIRSEKIANILPLYNSLNNPSPAIGWNNNERTAFYDRIKGDLILALALIHHLAIGSNVPLSLIADWLVPMGKYLIIEFVPKEDEKVKLLLQNREDIFTDYTLNNFEIVFSNFYNILKKQTVGNTQRTLFLLQRR